MCPTGASSLANSAISVDYEAPSITSFSVRNTSGEDISSSVVGVGDTLTIVAQMSEAISPSSSNTVTIGSVDVVMSVDADDPSVMTGTYVVPSDVSSEFLEVTGVTSGTVEDSFGQRYDVDRCAHQRIIVNEQCDFG